MKNIRSYVCALFLAGFYAADAGALVYSNPSSWYADLIGKSQNQIFESKPLSLPEARNISPLPKYAKVHFIVDTNDKLGFDNIEQSFDHDNVNRCETLGFNKTGACGANERVSRYCPYDNSYYDQCCDLNFGYAKAECSYPNTISGNSCGGKFKCYCDRSIYPYTATSCPSPKIHNEDKCAEVTYSAGKATTSVYYSDCLCPSTWITCDSSIHQKGNGTACEYNGVTTYASCTCEAGYSLLCDEFGPQSPMDYCFLKGTKYYKTCKTEKDVCESLGYKYSKDEPCDADSVIASYCPRGSGNTYFSCKIDPDKYCKNRGYTQAACGAYETQSSSKCNVPGYGVQESYRKCNATCKSRLANAGYKEINEGLWYKGTTAVVFKDINNINLTNPLGSAYTDVKGEAALNKYDGYSECSSWNKPTLTIGSNSGHTLLTKNLNNVYVTIDHAGTEGLGYTGLSAGGSWRDVYITESNTSGFGDQPSDAYGDIHVMKKSTRLHVGGTLTLNGNNTFSSGSWVWTINKDNNQKIGMFHLEVNGGGKVHIEGGTTNFYGVPILQYETTAGAEFVIGNATFKQTNSGFRTNGGQAWLYLSNADATFYKIWIDGSSAAHENFHVTNKSNLHVTGNMRMYNSKLSIYGNSTVIQDWETIGVCNKDRICIGSGSKLCSSGTAHCKYGAAAYHASPGKGDCDWAWAGYKDWYKTDYNTVTSWCGWYNK